MGFFFKVELFDVWMFGIRECGDDRVGRDRNWEENVGIMI
jgi:hypothetical protein